MDNQVRPITKPDKEPCFMCHGTGALQLMQNKTKVCPDCDGTGKKCHPSTEQKQALKDLWDRGNMW
jgi:DnaJ-class molecular chaperone